MALYKEKSILDGQVQVAYHRLFIINDIYNTEFSQVARVQVEEFSSEEAAKISKKQNLGTSNYYIPFTKKELISSELDIYAFMYTKLLTLPEFEGATNV